MIEVTFLGVGAALPAPGATNCAYVVRAGAMTLLFDCGPCVLQQLAAVGLTPGDVTHLFVSHRHGDHALGYPMFLLWHFLEGERPLPTVIASSDAWPVLDALWSSVYPDGPTPAVGRVELPSGQPSVLPGPGGAVLHTRPMVHSEKVATLGLRLEAGGKVVAFSADSARCDSVVELARGADLLVCDARYAATVEPVRKEPSKAHCTALEAGELAQEAGARRLALVHIGAEYVGRHAALVAEAKTTFEGEVFAPGAGDVFRC